ncbi:hypothetical protein SCP_1503310 [Sparassis crispa]|uniref:Uncharacterized protein n=1 Tax=Sparassis crispa TaxID=139825 RepID=A0A401H4J2_9APHY|nr:hypothetical protein SCP_1503310 [Sparassis crispa]GBE89323.1 hypothetical protein SCP_1503310 [Sparassis crispa]
MPAKRNPTSFTVTVTTGAGGMKTRRSTVQDTADDDDNVDDRGQSTDKNEPVPPADVRNDAGDPSREADPSRSGRSERDGVVDMSGDRDARTGAADDNTLSQLWNDTEDLLAAIKVRFNESDVSYQQAISYANRATHEANATRARAVNAQRDFEEAIETPLREFSSRVADEATHQSRLPIGVEGDRPQSPPINSDDYVERSLDMLFRPRDRNETDAMYNLRLNGQTHFLDARGAEQWRREREARINETWQQAESRVDMHARWGSAMPFATLCTAFGDAPPPEPPGGGGNNNPPHRGGLPARGRGPHSSGRGFRSGGFPGGGGDGGPPDGDGNSSPHGSGSDGDDGDDDESSKRPSVRNLDRHATRSPSYLQGRHSMPRGSVPRQQQQPQPGYTLPAVDDSFMRDGVKTIREMIRKKVGQALPERIALENFPLPDKYSDFDEDWHQFMGQLLKDNIASVTVASTLYAPLAPSSSPPPTASALKVFIPPTFLLYKRPSGGIVRWKFAARYELQPPPFGPSRRGPRPEFTSPQPELLGIRIARRTGSLQAEADALSVWARGTLPGPNAEAAPEQPAPGPSNIAPTAADSTQDGHATIAGDPVGNTLTEPVPRQDAVITDVNPAAVNGNPA